MSLEDALKANTDAVNKLLAAINALPAEIAKAVSNISLPSSATGKSDTKSDSKPDPLAEFTATLANINWKWEDADDPAVFKAGKAAVAAAKEAATKLGKKALAAFEAAQKKGLAGEPAASASNAGDSSASGGETDGGGDTIPLTDLQKLLQQIQGFKTKDADKGAKAMEDFKKDVLAPIMGGVRLSDPNLDKSKYPAIKTALEKIISDHNIPAVA